MSRIITSPGLQITEKDLSLRVFTPAGTQVVVPGFAPQGPTSEPIMITSVSELEATYGYPTNAAERYFYYTCKEILNSPAVLNCLRLPYGAEGGSDFSKSYSGLFYPAELTYTNGISSWEIGAPRSIVLNEDDYGSIVRGDFEWVTPDETSLFTPANGGELAECGAGFFFLNDLQSTINEVGEGYYIAISENSAVSASSPDYNSIVKMYSLSASETYSPMLPERLDFALSATKIEADKGADSISETLEKVGFIDYEKTSYGDHLSIGVYKVRISQQDPSLLTLGATERYLGSASGNRKTVSPTGGGLVNAFIQEIINAKSSTVKMYVHPDIRDFQWTAGSVDPVHTIRMKDEAKALFPIGVYTPDSRDQALTKQVGKIPLKLSKALRSVDNPEYFTVDVLIDAGLSNIYATSKYRAYLKELEGNTSPTEEDIADAIEAAGEVRLAYDDEVSVPDYNVDSEAFAEFAGDWKSVVNELINFSQNTRKDCFTVIDPPRSIFVSGRTTKVLSLPNKTFTQHVYNPLKECTGALDSNYAAIYANWIQQADLFTGKKFWIPNSGYVAAIIGRSDAVAAPWAAPAGLNRGQFSNALDIAINPNQKMRDRLYEIGVNPILFFSGDGYAVYGQKTLQSKPTAFDRINVRRLFLYLERATAKTAQYFVFEPNTPFTRQRVVSTLSPIFSLAKSTQGVYDYMIVCDERNNPPDVIDQNELVVDIYIKPVRTAEFVLLNFIAARTGASFQELM